MSDHCRNDSRSDTGTPISSQITVTDIGNAYASISSVSAGPCSIASSSESVTAIIRGCSDVARPGVKA